MGEESKVGIRNIRRDGMEKLKALKKDSTITEDDQKNGEKKIQELTDKFIKNIDALVSEKEKEVLSL